MREFMPHSRLRISGVLFLSLIAASLLATPVRTFAQEAPATSSEAKPEAPKTPEEQSRALKEDNKIVTATAKALNVSKEKAATIYEVVNFAILALLILIPLGRTLPKVFRQRSQNLKHNLDEARKATDDAHRRLSAIETKLGGLDAEIAAIRAQVEEDSRQDEIRIKASIEDEKTRIVAQAEQEIGVAALHASRQLRNFAADLAIEQASKQIVLTPESDRALIAEFLKDTAKGGQN